MEIPRRWQGKGVLLGEDGEDLELLRAIPRKILAPRTVWKPPRARGF
jgi:hypothetical protein